MATTNKKLNIYQKLADIQKTVYKAVKTKKGIPSFKGTPYFTEEQTFEIWNKYNTHNLILIFSADKESIKYIRESRDTKTESALMGAPATIKTSWFSGITGILNWKVIDGDVEDGSSFISGCTPYGNLNSSSNMSFGIESAKTYARRNVIGEILLLTVNGDTDPESVGNVKTQINSGIMMKSNTIYNNDPTVIQRVPVSNVAPMAPMAPVAPIAPTPITPMAPMAPIAPVAPMVSTPVAQQPLATDIDTEYTNFVSSDEFVMCLKEPTNSQHIQSLVKTYGPTLTGLPQEEKIVILKWKK